MGIDYGVWYYRWEHDDTENNSRALLGRPKAAGNKTKQHYRGKIQDSISMHNNREPSLTPADT